jgi:hypothetical protein
VLHLESQIQRNFEQKEEFMSFNITAIGDNKKKHSVYVKTLGAALKKEIVLISIDDGPILEIKMKDFLATAEYAITNSDLRKRNPRRKFIKSMKAMREVPGWNDGRKRLQSTINAT